MPSLESLPSGALFVVSATKVADMFVKHLRRKSNIASQWALQRDSRPRRVLTRQKGPDVNLVPSRRTFHLPIQLLLEQREVPGQLLRRQWWAKRFFDSLHWLAA
jgi:hypothetical protein